MISAGLGTIVWSTIAFLIVLFVLKKFAWTPILSSLKEREDSIEDALRQADNARAEMANLTSQNQRILEEAKSERDKILSEAKDIRDKMVADAKSEADLQGKRIINEAREAIENEKMAALTEVKNLVAHLSVEIAEKVLNEKFQNQEEQKLFASKQLEQIKLN